MSVHTPGDDGSEELIIKSVISAVYRECKTVSALFPVSEVPFLCFFSPVSASHTGVYTCSHPDINNGPRFDLSDCVLRVQYQKLPNSTCSNPVIREGGS
jgi:hypothetical protein